MSTCRTSREHLQSCDSKVGSKLRCDGGQELGGVNQKGKARMLRQLRCSLLGHTPQRTRRHPHHWQPTYNLAKLLDQKYKYCHRFLLIVRCSCIGELT
jgi:hypothetical protein